MAPGSCNPDSYTIHDAGIAPDGGIGDGRDSEEWGDNKGWHDWSADQSFLSA